MTARSRRGGRRWDCSPEDARKALADLARVFNADAPLLADVPYSLEVEAATGPDATQTALTFEDNGKIARKA